jgi:hypothetical protein
MFDLIESNVSFPFDCAQALHTEGLCFGEKIIGGAFKKLNLSCGAFHLLCVPVEGGALVAELPSPIDCLILLIAQLDHERPRPDQGSVALVPSDEVCAVPLLGPGRRLDAGECRQQCGDAL